MKKELHDRLTPYEPHLNTAHHASFCRTIKSSDLDELRAIYREWKGVEFNGHMTCNSCVIRLLKELYDAYHEPVEYIKDEPSPSRIIRKDGEESQDGRDKADHKGQTSNNPDKDKKVTKVTKVTKQSGTKIPNKNNVKKLN